MLYLSWSVADGLLLIFSGLLLAAFLDECTSLLGMVLPLPRKVVLALVVLVVFLAAAAVVMWSGFSIVQQFDGFIDALGHQLRAVEQSVRAAGLLSSRTPSAASDGNHLIHLLFPDTQRLVGEARSALATLLGLFGEIIVSVLIGLFVAIDPSAYRRALLDMAPPIMRPRLSAIMAESARYLRRWLLGQLIGMVVLGLLTAAALTVLEVPDAMLLALQAGLFNFVPYLGAVAAGIPIVLMTIPLGATTAVLAIGAYTIIHLGIGYVLAPLIQQRTVRLLPGLTLASLVLFGMLFGLAGLALATPLAVVIRQIATGLHLDMAAFGAVPDPPPGANIAGMAGKTAANSR
ncbi:MAG: AI-2E family transporter [Proteobacteria bacterium]|nr:AI-2E family transporter [Pseudomonadota bacterium]